MMFFTRQTSDTNHCRLRSLLLILGLLAAVTCWHVGHKDSSSSNHEDASGFSDITDEDEEDFVTSNRSAINTVTLPVVDFLAPVYNASNPSLILHVGPVKSGVRELQKELLALQGDLENDDYVLSASMDTSGLHYACQQELNVVRQEYSKKKKKSKSTLQQVLKVVPCWKTLLDVLKPLKESGTSLIISNEQLSQQFLPDVYGIGPAVLDWITLRETVMEDWNIVAVVSYRRYYDWVLAAKASTEQYHLQQHSSRPPRLARWPDRENGMLLEPLFPHFLNNAIEKLDVPFTDRTLALYRPFVSATKILNLYATGQSAITSFVCDVLEMATISCADSRQQDLKAGGSVSDKNPRATPAIVLDTAADAAWSDFQLFDELVTTAAARTLLRTKFVTRTIATTTTQYYVEQYMKLRAHDLPLSCPRADQSLRFLRESIAYEKKILPRAFAKAAEQAHTNGFEEMGNQLCSINMRAVLRQEHWRTFFRHLTNNSAQRIQAGGKPGPMRKFFIRG